MQFNDRILAIDDHVDNLMILEELLGADYTIRCVSSGGERFALRPSFSRTLYCSTS